MMYVIGGTGERLTRLFRLRNAALAGASEFGFGSRTYRHGRRGSPGSATSPRLSGTISSHWK
jgi:hypothetical protein